MANQRTDTESVINLVINGRQAMTTLKELTDTQRKLNTELKNMKASDPGYKAMLEQLEQVGKAFRERKKEIQDMSGESNKFMLDWTEISKGILSADFAKKALEAVVDIFAKVKDAYAQAEKNRAVLTNAFKGDGKQADEALSMLMDFAAKTPEGLQEATSAYLKLVNRGIKPTREEMVNLGDVAASQGKSMDQYVEAILDAQTGENERLKELGIRATKNGDTVSFAFKGVTKEVKNTEEAIYKALLGFGQMDGVKGTMEAVSQTVIGLESNISDTWDQIFTKLGQKSAGFIHDLYRAYSDALEWINNDLLSTETAAQRLTKQFKSQATEVNNLEQNIFPLLDRYDVLKKKGKLNTDEQAELSKILKTVSATLPGAVTEWDKYANALDLNTGKAREFIKIQKVMLKVQNKKAVDEAQKEIKEFTETRDAYLKTLNAGQITTMSVGSGLAVSGHESTTKLTAEQYKNYRDGVIKLNEMISERNLLIKGLNGDYLNDLDNSKEDKVVEEYFGRTEAVIEKEIQALMEKKKKLDVHSKDYEKVINQINKLEDELARAQGKKIDPKIKQEKEKALADFNTLGEEYKKLGIDRLDTQLEQNAREIEQEKRKYDELIKKEQDFIKQSGTTQEQREKAQEQIDALKVEKATAVTNITLRQETEMNKKIATMRLGFSKVQATELYKQKVQINEFYDALEKENTGKQKILDDLKIARAKDLGDAELSEKERLEKEKKQIEAKYKTYDGNRAENSLAAIHKKYDDEIAALKEKFSTELQLTEEFKNAVASIEKNRNAEIAVTSKDLASKDKDYKIQMAQAASDATFSIISNNQKAQLDRTLSTLETQRNAELSKKNLTEKQKQEINKKYDEKVKEAKLKAWKQEKAAAVAQAVVNGALAVTKVLAQTGILSPWAIPAIAASTAAQIAVIVAQKTPEFAKGVRNFKGGTALVGEEGAEAINENGHWWITSGPTLANLAPGTDVYTASDTAAMTSKGKSLGDCLYKSAAYTIDDTAVRAAERNYRSAGNAGYQSSSTAPAISQQPVATTTDELGELRQMVTRLVELQQKESEKTVQLVYQQLEQFADNVKNVRISQSA